MTRLKFDLYSEKHPKMALINISDSDFEEKVIKANLPVFVDFFAPWCAPCKMAEPVIEEMAKDHEGKVTFAKINVDENPQSSSKFDVMSIPTTLVFKDGKEVARQTGFSGRQTFEELIKKAI
ncbi:thioredoxin [Patescibacteria group bacterium]